MKNKVNKRLIVIASDISYILFPFLQLFNNLVVTLLVLVVASDAQRRRPSTMAYLNSRYISQSIQFQGQVTRILLFQLLSGLEVYRNKTFLISCYFRLPVALRK